MAAVMLTTADNPFSPFTQWDEWLRFDEDHKYFTCSYLARIAQTADDLPEEENELEIARAIDEIIGFNLTGKYKKVIQET